MNTLSQYLIDFRNLRIDKAHGPAPHKPILLLSVLNAYSSKQISDNRIYITQELVALFKTIWSTLVRTDNDCKFSLPFTYLSSEKFWHLEPKAGFENIIQLKSSLRSFANLNAAIDFAFIDEELAGLMMEPDSNAILSQFLLETYFPNEKENGLQLINAEKIFAKSIDDKILQTNSDDYKKEIKQLIDQKNQEEVFIRGGIFKRVIPKVYNNTCCISGMRVDAISSISMIDACHVIPFAKSFDDTITNGIALCPNLHRAFDRGLISINENFQVVISKSFKEDNSNYSIRAFEKIQILLPIEQRFFPQLSNLKWHRENIFKQT